MKITLTYKTDFNSNYSHSIQNTLEIQQKQRRTKIWRIWRELSRYFLVSPRLLYGSSFHMRRPRPELALRSIYGQIESVCWKDGPAESLMTKACMGGLCAAFRTCMVMRDVFDWAFGVDRILFGWFYTILNLFGEVVGVFKLIKLILIYYINSFFLHMWRVTSIVDK